MLWPPPPLRPWPWASGWCAQTTPPTSSSAASTTASSTGTSRWPHAPACRGFCAQTAATCSQGVMLQGTGCAGALCKPLRPLLPVWDDDMWEVGTNGIGEVQRVVKMMYRTWMVQANLLAWLPDAPLSNCCMQA
eukprot:1140566-Pelagomonas_calceolata.AAC.5